MHEFPVPALVFIISQMHHFTIKLKLSCYHIEEWFQTLGLKAFFKRSEDEFKTIFTPEVTFLCKVLKAGKQSHSESDTSIFKELTMEVAEE